MDFSWMAWTLPTALFFGGIFTLIGSFTQPDQSSGTRVMMAISGAISIVLGLIAFQGVAQAQAVLVLVVGVSWVFTGIVTLIAGINAAGVPGGCGHLAYRGQREHRRLLEAPARRGAGRSRRG